MKTRYTAIATLLFALSLVFIPAVLAEHQWVITDVICDPESQTITVYGISTLDTSGYTDVYADGVYIGSFEDGSFVDGPVSFDLSDPRFVAGAVILVENPFPGDFGASSATTVCGSGPGGTQWFEPGDDRINRQAYAPIAVYCADTQLEILAINSEGEGSPVIVADYSTLPGVPSAANGNTLIQTAGNIQLYRLLSGEYLARVGPDAEGKFYRLVWDGCPQTYIVASIEQNGVITVAEVSPHD